MSSRRKKFIALLAAVAVLVPGLAFTPALLERDGSALSAAPDGREFGFSPSATLLWMSDTQLAADLDRMRSVGATWVRVDFDWPSIQPKSASQFNWGPTDRVVSAVHARGMRVLALPTYTPGWARPGGTTAKYPPSNPDNYANFVRAAAQRYASQGVRDWEIWNEPNNGNVWQPKPDAAAYTALLKKAYTAIHAVDPGSNVVSGGLSPGTDALGGLRVRQKDFLEAMYAAGAKGYFDAFGTHPYSFPYDPMTADSWNPFYNTPALYDVLAAHGDGGMEIWGTEIGFPTGTSTKAVNEATQADRLQAAVQSWSRWAWHGPIFWYALRDAGTNAGDFAQNFGIVRADGSLKPAYARLELMLKAPQDVVATPEVGKATVRWSAPGYDYGDAITGYKVVASPGGATVTVGGSARSASLPLTNGQAYRFTVQAIHGSRAGLTSLATAPVTVGVPFILPGSASILEGRGLTRVLEVPVRLSNPSTQVVTVRYATGKLAPYWMANPPYDYDATSGTLTWQPGETTKVVPIVVKGDPYVETDDQILLTFASPTNANLGGYGGLGVGVILNDD